MGSKYSGMNVKTKYIHRIKYNPQMLKRKYHCRRYLLLYGRIILQWIIQKQRATMDWNHLLQQFKW